MVIIMLFLGIFCTVSGYAFTDNAAGKQDAVNEDTGPGQEYNFSEYSLAVRYAPGFIVYSKFFWMSPYLNGVELDFRFLNLMEAAVRIFSPFNTTYSSPLFFFGEFRFAPRIGNYMPSIGAGLCMSTMDAYVYGIDINQGLFSVYIMAAPLRFDLRLSDLFETNLGIVFSVFELRYGSLLPSGESPSLHSTGDFFFEITLFSLGCSLQF